MPRRMVPVQVVDAFTSVPFAGNPAGVVLLPNDDNAPESWMKHVAAEMRHAETAFLKPRPHSTPSPTSADYDLRWFTPELEVDLCGHATLAAAHTLFSSHPHLTEVAFHTRSGRLDCRLAPNTAAGRIEMDFPALPLETIVAPDGLLQALRVRPVSVGRSKFDLLVELRTEREVRECKPDLRQLIAIETRGVIIAAAPALQPSRGGAGMYDVVSRFFAPRCGVDEDPVTGSAHCVIGPTFAPRLGKSELRCYQASPRGGIVNLRLSPHTVTLSGDAITTLQGEILAWKN